MGKITAALFLIAWSLSAQYFPPGGSGGTPTTPASPPSSLQYNNAGVFGGMAGTSWTDATKTLVLTDPVITILSNSFNMFNFATDLVNGTPDCVTYLFYINCDGSGPSSVSGATGTNGLNIEMDAILGGQTTIITSGAGGTGGRITLASGNGGTAPAAATDSTGGHGGDIELTLGSGGSANQAANIGINIGQRGGNFVLSPGTGGHASGGTSNTGGDGSSVKIGLGSGGLGSTANGLDGTLILTAGARANAPIMQWKANGGGLLASIGATGNASLPALIGNSSIPALGTCGTIGTGSTNLAGFITSGTTGSCVSVLTLTTTAPTGWSCAISNSTTANLIRQTGSSQTTATFTGVTVTNDILRYACIAY